MQDAATRIDFYVLESTSPSDRLSFVCRLCEKAYAAGHSIFLLTRSASQSGELDKLLWTYKTNSFLPHERSGDSQQATAPIIIGEQLPPAEGRAANDVLINLQDEMPSDSARFGRIAEVIDGSAQVREAGRKRFSDYKSAGFDPLTHKIGSA